MRNTLRNLTARLIGKQRSSRILQQACQAVQPTGFGLENLEARQMLALADLTHFNFDDAGGLAGGNIIYDETGAWFGSYVTDGGTGVPDVVTGRTGVGTDKAILLNNPSSDKDHIQFDDWAGTNLSDIIGGNATVAFWVKTPPSFIGGSGNAYDGPVIFGVEDSGGGNDIFWGAILSTGQISFRVGDSGQVVSTSPVNDGKWHHVAMSRTVDGTRNDTTPAPAAGTVWLYVDGFMNATATYSDTLGLALKTGNTYKDLGKLNKTNVALAPVYLNGVTVDDLYFGSQAISDTEAKTLYDPSLLVPSPASNLRVDNAPTDIGSVGARIAWDFTAASGTGLLSGFRLERLNGATWATVATLGSGQRQYIVRNLTPSTSNTFRVVAFGAWGDATPSNTKDITTLAQVAYTPGTNPTGVVGTYFDDGGLPDPATGLVDMNQAWKGKMVQRTDPQIDFNWGTGSPDPRIGVDTFSSMWEGKIRIPKADYYTFETLSDDGAFLSIDLNGNGSVNDAGEQVIADPTYHGMNLGVDEKSSNALNPGGLLLQPGLYNFKMLSYENGSGAGAILRWSSLNIAAETIPVSQFYQPDAEASLPASPSGLTATAAGANTVNLAWTDNAINERGYIVYRSKDAGVSFEEWARVNGTSYSDATLVFPGQTYIYNVQAFNLLGNSAGIAGPASATTATRITSPVSGLWLEYWNLRGTAAGLPTTPAEFTRVEVNRTEGANTGVINYPDLSDNAVNKYWTKLNIPAETDGLNYSMRWSGVFVPPTTGNYTFWTRTDDDVRFYFGGIRLIAANDANNFTAGRGAPGAPGDSSGGLMLYAGVSYQIRMDSAQGGGGATFELRYQGPSIAQAIVPQTVTINSVVNNLLYSDLRLITAAPTGLTATYGSGSVRLAWTPTGEGNTVEQFDSVAGAWKTVLNIADYRTLNNVQVSGLAPSTQYQFRVRSYNPLGESAPSTTVTITTKAMDAVNPVDNWEFNEGSGTFSADLVAGGTNANLQNGSFWTLRGHSNASVRVPEGTVQVADSPQLNPTNQITVMAWYNAYDLAGNRRILQKGDSDNQYSVRFEDLPIQGVTEKYLRFHISGKPIVQVKASTIANVTGQWHHVAGTYDGAAIKLYVDGVEVASAAAAGIMPVTTNPLYIGSRGGGAVSDRMSGKVDGVRVYDTAQSASAIAGLAAETAPVAPSNVVINVPGSGQGLFRLDISWKDNSVTNFPSFRLYRSSVSANGPFDLLPVAVDATIYMDTTVTPNTTYWYKVESFNRLSAAMSAVSASAKTDTAPPGILTGTSSALSGEVNLTTTGTADWAHFGLNSATDFTSADRLIPGNAIVTQKPFTDFLAWEGEQAVTATDPDLDGLGVQILDATSNPTVNNLVTDSTTASGGRGLMLNEGPGGSPHRLQAFAQWNLKIDNPGFYRLYIRRRANDTTGTAGGTGDNDSVMLPRKFNAPLDSTRNFYTERTVASNNNWAWDNTGLNLHAAAAGNYTLPIGVREGGYTIDRLILSKSTGLSTAQLDATANSLITGEISSSMIGTGTPTQVSAPAGTSFTWNDGTPAAAQTQTPQGVAVSGLGNGFRISAPARSMLNRKLRVYVGVSGTGAKGQLFAQVVDKSATAYQPVALTNTGSGVIVQMYEISFQSGVDNQMLNVDWTNAAATGSVAVFGAAWIDVAPAAPINVTVQPVNSNAMALKWTDNSANERTFRIERSSDGGSTYNPIGTALAESTTFVDTSAVAGYKYRVFAVNGAGDSAASNVVDGRVLVAPSGIWTAADIGAVGIAGTTYVDGANATSARITASGGDIWNNADQFRYLYTPVSGDFTITARILPFDEWNAAGGDADQWVKAGVMVRESTAPGSKHVMEAETPGQLIHTQYRQFTDGGSSDSPGGIGGFHAAWVRVQRTGGVFYTAWSFDGQVWYPDTQMVLSNSPAADGNSRVLMPDQVLVGIAVTSHDNANQIEVNFDNISLVTSATAPAAPTGLVASAISGDRVTLRWQDNSNNETDFIVERSDDSGTTWSEITTSNNWALGTAAAPGYGTRPGNNIAQYLDAGPAGAGLPDGVAVQYRVSAASWARVSAPSNVAMATTTAAVVAPPAPWVGTDLAANAANNVSYDANTNTIAITAATGDWWNNADSVYYVNQPASGDFSITTQIVYQDNRAAWSKAGLDIRESATGNSAHVGLVVTPTNGLQFAWRDSTGAGSDGIYTGQNFLLDSGRNGKYIAPIFLRITRVGNDFTGFYSNDGVNWTQYGRHTTVMATDVTAGMMHCNNNGTAGVSTYVGTTIGAPILATGSTSPINLANFTGVSDWTLNGWARIGASGALELVGGGQNQRGTAFTSVPHQVKKFTAAFDFIVPKSAEADGFTFAIQNQTPKYIAAGGGSLSYAGNAIANQNAMAIKFDIYNNLDQTGVYVNNTMNDNLGSGTNYYGTSDLRVYGIDIDGGRRYHVDVDVNGTLVTWKITDVLAPAVTFTNAVTLPSDIPTIMGSQFAYMGFTVATGGQTFQPSILNFAYTPGITEGPMDIAGTAGADIIYVKLEGATVNVYGTADATGAVLASKPLSEITAINVNAGDGDDLVIFDLGAGFAKPVSLDGGAGTDTIRAAGLDNVIIIGSLTIDGQVITSNAEIVDAGDGNDTINVSVAGANVNGGAGSDTVNVNAGATIPTMAGVEALALNAGSHSLGDNVVGLSLTINEASAVLTKDVSVAGLAINGSGVLNQKTFDVTVVGGDLATLEGYVKGGQLMSDMTTVTTTLGVIPKAGSVLVKYTYFGDVNGDGVVNLNDYSVIDWGYLNKLPGYANGDVNYDGAINLNDYTLIDWAYLNQSGILSAPQAAATPVFSNTRVAKARKARKAARKVRKIRHARQA